MDEDTRKAAESLFEAALEETGARDPREFYRARLRELKSEDPARYEEAVRHYADDLIPSIASGEIPPLEAWLRYGVRLAELSAPGRTWDVDPTGKRHTHAVPTPPDRLVLHIPDAKGERAILVGLPREPTKAQRATFSVLVQGKLKLPPAERPGAQPAGPKGG
jgi:hypothetical protein